MSSPPEITCLIVDDHEVVREGLRLSLSRAPHIRVIGEASDGASAVALAERRRPNVVIMDVRMPGMDGLEATKILTEKIPESAVLIFTAYSERSLLGRGLESGAKGYILKEAPHQTLLRAIEKVAAGEGYVDPALMPAFLTGKDKDEMLTGREREILQLLADGMSNQDVAAKLFISQETVKSHVRHILAKLEADTRAGLLVLAFAAAAVLAIVALAVGSHPLTLGGLAAAIALAGLLAAYLLVTERRRHEAAELELTSEARFLESLVETMGSIAGSPDVLERTRQEAERLFEARARLLDPGERPRRAPAENAIVIPLQAHDNEIGALRLTRDRAFDREDLVRATVLADFAAREHENAQLLEDAQLREAERSQLSDQLLTAEQDERRRLANELHDGAVQSLSGVALLLDAGLNSIAEGRGAEAREIIGRALERHRATIGQLRSLSFNLEPVVLRDQGFAPAVRALTDQIALAHHVRVDLDVDAADQLAEKTQAALYQIIREALNQAVRRGPPHTLSVTMRQADEGGVETLIADDAPGERRRRSLEELAERARTLNGVLTVHPGDRGGTTVRVVLPPYAIAR